MANNITQYNATAGSNTTIDSISIDEGMAASNVNNAIRSLMSHLKNVDTGTQALTALSVTGALSAKGGAVFNEDSADVDFRVESNGNANMLVVNGGTDKVGIGTNSPNTIFTTSSASEAVGVSAQTATTGSFIGFKDATSTNWYYNHIGAVGDNLKFTTAGSEQVRIHSNGVLSASDGIALGVGTANTASNVLDDYEEGTWTPTLTDGSNDATVNSGSTGGTYTKIGRMVAVTGRCTTSSVSGLSSIVYVKNLPFTSLSGQAGYATLAVGQAFNLNISAGQSVELSVSPNDTKAQVRLNDHGSGNTHMSPSEWSDDGYVMFSGVYVTA